MKCCICHKTIEHVGVLHRVNAKGVPGVYACGKHVGQTDAVVDPEVREITNILSGKS